MPTRVLIIDPNESFATLLKEALEADREYQTVAVISGQAALDALAADAFDLAILDLGLDNPEPSALMRAMRDRRPDLALIVIPVDGDIVPQDIVSFDIKGVLTKPFFLPELPARVAEALGRPLPAPTPMPTAPTSPPDTRIRSAPVRAVPRIKLPKDDPRVSAALQSMANTVSADAVLILDGNSLAARAGSLSPADADALTQTLLDARSASAQAWGASHEQVRFSQSVADSGECLIYSLNFAEGIVLTVVVRPDSSLRVVREQARKTARELLALGQ